VHAASQSLPLSLVVAPVIAPERYQGARIVLRRQDSQGVQLVDLVAGYEYEDRLPLLIQRDVARMIEDTKLFAHGVRLRPADAKDRILEITIERFDLTMDEGASLGEATIVWRVAFADPNTLRVLQQQRMTLVRRLEGATFAKAMATLKEVYHQMLDQTLTWLMQTATTCGEQMPCR
jgi:ABC-type uncharacterized transport system auxiliary subunit